MRDALPGTGNRGQPNYTTCGGWALSENPTYCAFWSVFGATCLSLQPLASSVGFGDDGGRRHKRVVDGRDGSENPKPASVRDHAADGPGNGMGRSAVDSADGGGRRNERIQPDGSGDGTDRRLFVRTDIGYGGERTTAVGGGRLERRVDQRHGS